MMNVEVFRYCYGQESTLGRLYVDGEFFGFTLEDEVRDPGEKVQGETAIPPGRYEVILREEGGMTQRYHDRFPELHRGMLWLQDVPGFDWIYLHIGNTEEHSKGCILVATHPVILPSGEFEIARSTDTYLALYRRILAAMDQGERVWVHVHDQMGRRTT